MSIPYIMQPNQDIAKPVSDIYVYMIITISWISCTSVLRYISLGLGDYILCSSMTPTTLKCLPGTSCNNIIRNIEQWYWRWKTWNSNIFKYNHNQHTIIMVYDGKWSNLNRYTIPSVHCTHLQQLCYQWMTILLFLGRLFWCNLIIDHTLMSLIKVTWYFSRTSVFLF